MYVLVSTITARKEVNLQSRVQSNPLAILLYDPKPNSLINRQGTTWLTKPVVVPRDYLDFLLVNE
jgi:hypothetical protein